MPSKELATYRVYLNPRPNLPGAALLDLRPKEGGLYWLWFTATTPLPPNSISDTIGVAYFPLTMLDTVIDLLRNETPAYVYADPVTQRFSITTSPEPLGEGPVDTSP